MEIEKEFRIGVFVPGLKSTETKTNDSALVYRAIKEFLEYKRGTLTITQRIIQKP